MKIFLSLVCCAMLCGCGHNVVSYFNGERMNIGIDPNTGEAGIQLTSGEAVSIVDRENVSVEIEMQKDIEGSSELGKAGKIAKIKYTVGQQINGRTVELAKVSPELCKEYLLKTNKKYYIIEDGKIKEVDQENYNK